MSCVRSFHLIGCFRVRGVDTTYSVRQEFNKLYDRIAATCAKGGEVEDDLMAYREQQKLKIHEIQVSRANLIGISMRT